MWVREILTFKLLFFEYFFSLLCDSVLVFLFFVFSISNNVKDRSILNFYFLFIITAVESCLLLFVFCVCVDCVELSLWRAVFKISSNQRKSALTRTFCATTIFIKNTKYIINLQQKKSKIEKPSLWQLNVA